MRPSDTSRARSLRLRRKVARAQRWRLLFTEVKGRHKNGDTTTITRNEIYAGIEKPEAVVQVDGTEVEAPGYVRQPFGREPHLGVTSVNRDIREMLARVGDPS